MEENDCLLIMLIKLVCGIFNLLFIDPGMCLQYSLSCYKRKQYFFNISNQFSDRKFISEPEYFYIKKLWNFSVVE